MTVEEIGRACMELWAQLRFREVYDTYYSDDAVKVEPVPWADHPNELRGKQAIADHEEWLAENWVTVNSLKFEGPFVGAYGFSVIITNDFIMKDSGEHLVYPEIGVYFVEGGKIVREEFFYHEIGMREARRLNERAAATESS